MDKLKEEIKSDLKAEILENDKEKQQDDIEEKVEEQGTLSEKENKQEEANHRFKKMDKQGKKRVSHIFGIILALTILLTTILTGFALLNLYNNKIIKGVMVENISLEGLTIDEAIQLLNDKLNNNLEREILLSADGQEYSIMPAQIDVSYNIDEIVNQAYNIGRTGNIIQNNFEILKTFFNKKNMQIDIKYDEQALDEILNDISTKFEDAMIDNTYCIENDKLIISRGKSGLALNIEKAQEDILREIKEKSNKKIILEIESKDCPEIDINKIYEEVHCEPQNAFYNSEPFEIIPHKNGIDFDLEEAKKILADDKEEYVIKLTITKPEVLTSDIGEEAFPDLLGSCSTKFDVTNVSRTKNVKLALEKINGVVLMPGETFSYNNTLGERTIEAGYGYAGGYAGGKVVQMVGGGICQVSSTLYTAVLYANEEIVERYNHMFLTSYIGAGKDATVVYGSLDFKFKNTRNYPIKIEATSNSGVAEVKIYGKKEEVEYEVEIETTILSYIPYSTIYEEDKSLTPGQEVVEQNAMRGCKSKTYRILKLNGQEVSRELLSNDTYSAMNKIIKVNTDAPIQEETNSSTTNTEIESDTQEQENTNTPSQETITPSTPDTDENQENQSETTQITNNTTNEGTTIPGEENNQEE